MHREVDFECSPYLDKEYDIPMVKDVVNQMINNELKTFAPKDYLTFLPYPKLNFADSPLLQSEFNRIKEKKEMQKLDFSRYNIPQPVPALDKDVQAWRQCVNNIKSQQQHQRNRLLNLNVMSGKDLNIKELNDDIDIDDNNEDNNKNINKNEPIVAPLHRNYHKSLENTERILQNNISNLKRKIDNITVQRKTLAETTEREFKRCNIRKNEAIQSVWRLDIACKNYENELKNKGINDIDEAINQLIATEELEKQNYNNSMDYN